MLPMTLASLSTIVNDRRPSPLKWPGSYVLSPSGARFIEVQVINKSGYVTTSPAECSLYSPGGGSLIDARSGGSTSSSRESCSCTTIPFFSLILMMVPWVCFPSTSFSSR